MSTRRNVSGRPYGARCGRSLGQPKTKKYASSGRMGQAPVDPMPTHLLLDPRGDDAGRGGQRARQSPVPVAAS